MSDKVREPLVWTKVIFAGQNGFSFLVLLTVSHSLQLKASPIDETQGRPLPHCGSPGRHPPWSVPAHSSAPPRPYSDRRLDSNTAAAALPSSQIASQISSLLLNPKLRDTQSWPIAPWLLLHPKHHSWTAQLKGPLLPQTYADAPGQKQVLLPLSYLFVLHRAGQDGP